MPSKNRPPLTREDLLAIRDRGRGQPDVNVLLWEIHRLRAMVLRSHDYFRQSPSSSTAGLVAEGLLRDLGEEPVVKEQPKIYGKNRFRNGAPKRVAAGLDCRVIWPCCGNEIVASR